MKKQTLLSCGFVTVLGLAWAGFSLLFNFGPRTRFSELEKRELAVFPAFSADSLRSGAFTSAVSSWYSDSGPLRDRFLYLSMAFDAALGVTQPGGGEKIRYHAPKAGDAPAPGNPSADDAPFIGADAGTKGPSAAPGEDGPSGTPSPADTASYPEWADSGTVAEKAKFAHSGILILGEGANVRALAGFGAQPSAGVAFARAVNRYDTVFGDSVRIYCMPIPTAAAYYWPVSARSRNAEQGPVVRNILVHLTPRVGAVDVWSVLGRHRAEDIYLRTDHHWSPLGAYYAAQEFARVAGVPFRDLSAYTEGVTRRYVGSMYGYSGDIAVKNAPEDFVYYIPSQVSYKTVFTQYYVDENLHVTGESKPFEGAFFRPRKDGSRSAYEMFVGSDQLLARVETSTRNGRRLLILKDSFGNAIPGYLFYSFEEIHVVDFRYFTRNMVKYVGEHHITDILFANNLYNCCSGYAPHCYQRFLTQRGGYALPPAPRDSVYRDSIRHAPARAAEPARETPARTDSTAASAPEPPVSETAEDQKPEAPDTTST